MRTLRHGLWPAGLAFGIVAESVGRPPLPALDAATGFTLIALGLLAWQMRPRLAAGAIMAAAGYAWFSARSPAGRCSCIGGRSRS